MSDSHDRWDHLEQAINQANDAGCTLLLFAGDLIAPPGLDVLETFNGDVKFVWGNNEGERVAMTRKMDASDKITLCDEIYDDTVDGIKIFMNHYPHVSRLAAKSGDYDVCIFGHTHQYHEEAVNNTLLINPGEIQGHRTGQSSFMILDTKTKEIKKILI